MRIGELAALVGVSTRAVRHYHRLGLLAEPPRLANGYRSYELRDVVVLARIRRLTELGLTLDEVRDALDDSRDLREILLELDGDLAKQEAELRARRARLATVAERARSGVDDVVTPELLALLDDLAARPTPLADRERELFTLLDTVATPTDRDATVAALRARAADPAAVERDTVLARRLTSLSDADADDPRIPELAAEIAAELADALPEDTIGAPEGPFAEAVLGSLSPAQAEVIRQALRRLALP